MENKNLSSHTAEQYVLGGLLLDNKAWEKMNGQLHDDDFYSPAHKLIFSVLVEEITAGRSIDVLLISEKLRLKDQLERVGGEAYLFLLAKNTPGTANIMSYVDVLNEKTLRRKVAAIGQALMNSADASNLEQEIISAQQQLLFAKKTNTHEKLTAYSVGDFLAKEIKPRALLLSPWLPEQGLAMIYAKRGVGKTFVGLNIAYAIASGGEFLNWKAEKTARVLYIDGEMPASVMQERLAAIVAVHDKEAQEFQILTPDMQKCGMPDLSTLDGQQLLEPFVEKAEVIIVDNISTLCRKTNENEADGWLPVQEWALRLRTQGKSVIFIHHAAKNGNQRGTSKREDVLDTVIVLKHPADYSQMDGAKFEIHFEKARGFSGNDAEPMLASLITDQVGKQRWAIETVEKSTYHQVINLHQEGLKPAEIAEELGINKSTVSRHLKRAKAEGLDNGHF